MKYLLGLDNGGTVIKAALFDVSGQQVAVASKKSDLITPRVGYAERDMEDLWAANAAAIREVIAKSGVQSKDIVGIGISGHGKGAYLLDKKGNPLGNGIVSTDNRALSYEIKFNATDIQKKIRETNYQNILACQPVCILAWLKDHDRQRYEAIGAILSVKDYIRYRLTGEIYAERTDISGTNLLDLTTGKYSEELLKLFGIEEVFSALPPVKNSYEICGRVTNIAAKATGLAEGTAVSGGLFDIDACALSMGIVDEEDICVIAGTWSINEFIRKSPAKTERGMNSYYCIPGYYLAEECSPTSAGNLDWVLKHFFKQEIKEAGGLNELFYSRLNKMVAEVNAEENTVVFLPFLFASNEGPGYKGTFLNLTADVTNAQIAEAVYEGIVFSHKTHIDRLLQSKSKLGEIRLAGGAANSEVWCQLFADVLQQNVKTGGAREQGCFGAALTAGIAAGIYADVEQMVKTSVHIEHIYYPDSEKGKMYAQKYKRYKEAVKALRPFYLIEE